ncbi:polysaccharide deacetylase family protein [Lysobacter korlensis]|uniref:Polysaccharide deacetylase family protein n=1 Tax=Lysobacter korlensis TaxID=553636 RepID=A0ABV6RRV1_9GAMM
MSTPFLHRPPRFPHAWLGFLVGSQLVVAWFWWRLGAGWGVPLMVASHLPFWWGTLRPGSQLFSPVLTRLPIDERVVWLTIDDGPSDDTPALLDLLDAHRARATFFLVGERAVARPELVREIAQRGHEIANHSYSHPQAWFWALGPVRMRREVDRAQQVLTQLGGTAPRRFRAVVGMANPFVSAPLKAHGLTRTGWTARGFDAVAADPAAVVARIERDLRPGAIVLLHEGARHERNVETLALLLQRLDALGYRAIVPAVAEADSASASTAACIGPGCG